MRRWLSEARALASEGLAAENTFSDNLDGMLRDNPNGMLRDNPNGMLRNRTTDRNDRNLSDKSSRYEPPTIILIQYLIPEPIL